MLADPRFSILTPVKLPPITVRSDGDNLKTYLGNCYEFQIQWCNPLHA